MATVRPIKTNFTNGEVDPLITMRSDLELTANGAALMRNVLAFPQGGFRRWDGLETMTKIPDPTPSTDFGLFEFSIVSGGSGYSVGDTITIVGGSQARPAVLLVGTTSGSIVTTVTILSMGLYITVAPPQPAPSSSSGPGTGATFNFNTTPVDFVPVVPLLPIIDAGNAGTGYSVGDEIELLGGVPMTVALFRVVAVSGGVITALEVIRLGFYQALPPNPADTRTTGGGIGAKVEWTDPGESQDVVKLVDFSFSISQNYIIVLTVGSIYIFRKEDTGSGANALVFSSLIFPVVTVPYSNAQLSEITWTQSLDVMIIFHNELPMRKLIRADESDWTFDEFFPANPPTFAFGDIQTADLTVTSLAAAVVGGTVTMTASAAAFTSAAEDVGKFIRIIAATDSEGLNFSSYYEITGFTSTTVLTGKIVVLPIITSSTASIKVGGANWLLEEVEFSHEHGYPRCGQFYQGRLITAATTDRPQTMFTSRAGDINDFNSGTTADDLGIVATASSGTQSTIQNIHAGRHLQLFADNAEYYIPISEVDPLTPTNVALRRTSSVGSLNEVPVFDVDGTVYFAQRGGQSFREFAFVDGVKAYESNIVSLFSSHLIRNPNDAAFKKSLSTEDGNYIWSVNDDFSLAAFSVLKSELINAWTLRTTAGKFKGVAVLDQDSYFHVTRSPGGSIDYSGFSRDLSASQGALSAPRGVALSKDGKKMLVLSDLNNTVYEYALNSLNSLERVVYTGNSFDFTAFDTVPTSLRLSADGLKLFIMGRVSEKIFEFDLGLPNTLVDVSDTGKFLDYSAQPGAASGTGFDISPDGKNWLITEFLFDTVFLFTSTDAFTFAGGTTDENNTLDLTPSGAPGDVQWGNDGLHFLILDGPDRLILQFKMTNAFDPSSGTLEAGTFFINEDAGPNGFASSDDGLTFMISGVATHAVYQYDLSTPFHFGEESDWIEFFQKDLKFDAAVAQFSGIVTPVTEITNQLQLAGSEVGIIIDDVIYENQVVDENGDMTFPIEAHYNFQVGLPFPNIIIQDENNQDVDTGFNVLVRTLPADILLGSGTTMGKKKRVPRCTIRFVDTQGFYLQDNLMPFRNLPQVLDRPIPLQTGEKELTGLLGYDNFGQITIGQKEPTAMTVLGLGYDLSTGT